MVHHHDEFVLNVPVNGQPVKLQPAAETALHDQSFLDRQQDVQWCFEHVEVVAVMTVKLQMTHCNSPAMKLPVPAPNGYSQCQCDVISDAVGEDGRSRQPQSWRCVASSTAHCPDEVLMMTAWLLWNPLGPCSSSHWAWQGLSWQGLSWSRTRELQFCSHSAAPEIDVRDTLCNVPIPGLKLWRPDSTNFYLTVRSSILPYNYCCHFAHQDRVLIK